MQKVGVLIVAYNALPHLVNKVLDKIPEQVWEEIDEVAVFDDASKDATYELAYGYKTVKKLDKLKVYKNETNLGYGGNQKKGFSYFAEKGFDAVVLLHGDGQYAPRMLSHMYKPIVENRADVVLGSRMMTQYSGPLRGGMPLYKYIGNRILSYWENRMLGMQLTEFHSGYRAYSVKALQKISLINCTNDFHFDTEIIVKLNHLNFRFLEIPIPTYYGDEICYVNGLKYALNVYRTVKEYKDTIAGLRTSNTYREFDVGDYVLKPYEFSSHSLVSQMIRGVGVKILDVGCGLGLLEELIDTQNNVIVGIDRVEDRKNQDKFGEFIVHDLERGLPVKQLKGQRFDYILLLDILEHLTNPTTVLQDIHQIADPDTRIIISVPNIANIYVRLKLLFGRFEYSNRGILDKTHVRFFTRLSLRRWVKDCGFAIERQLYTNIPINEVVGKRESGPLLKAINHILHFFTTLFSGLLAYQIILEVRPQKSTE